MEGLEFFVEHMTWKRLPKEVFEPLGGFAAAKQAKQDREKANESVVAKKAQLALDAQLEKDKEKNEKEAVAESDRVKVENGSSSGGEGGLGGSSSNASANGSKTEAKNKSKLLQYDLGKRWFSDALYAEFGASDVDTLEMSRKRLRTEALGDEDVKEIGKGGAPSNKVLLHKDLPVLLTRKNGLAKRVYNIPNVTWNLLDKST